MDAIERVRRFLEAAGLPRGDRYDLPDSSKRFADGGEYRIEIPSVEGPRALAAVLEEADRRAVTIHRVSQGSGIMMLTDDELDEMVRMGAEAGIEVSLFVGPRAAWSTSAQVRADAGKNLGARLRGMDEVVYATADVFRAVEHGIRSVLVADEGQLRLVVDLPLDIYVEVPDNFGSFVRHYEVPEMIRVAAPVYVKLGLRNAPDIYPSGAHLEETVVTLCRERVRRAKLVADQIARHAPDAAMSKPGAADLGVPIATS